ncbi:hypothetical protein BDZ89DRAFT_1041072 [Hymenopellis radicata]|nr:hypothetical protein BDZ89DRAFT_1041072 [Hymenopellis radicata]
MAPPIRYDTPELKAAAVKANKRRYYHKNREELLQAMKERYDRKAIEAGRKRRQQALRMAAPRTFDENLCKRLTRRVRQVDGELRATSGNAIIPFIASMVSEYEMQGVYKGSQYIGEQEDIYREKLGYVEGVLAEIQEEAGIDSSYWRDVKEICDRFQRVYDTVFNRNTVAMKILRTRSQKAGRRAFPSSSQYTLLHSPRSKKRVKMTSNLPRIYYELPPFPPCFPADQKDYMISLGREFVFTMQANPHWQFYAWNTQAEDWRDFKLRHTLAYNITFPLPYLFGETRQEHITRYAERNKLLRRGLAWAVTHLSYKKYGDDASRSRYQASPTSSSYHPQESTGGGRRRRLLPNSADSFVDDSIKHPHLLECPHIWALHAGDIVIYIVLIGFRQQCLNNCRVFCNLPANPSSPDSSAMDEDNDELSSDGDDAELSSDGDDAESSSDRDNDEDNKSSSDGEDDVSSSDDDYEDSSSSSSSSSSTSATSTDYTPPSTPPRGVKRRTPDSPFLDSPEMEARFNAKVVYWTTKIKAELAAMPPPPPAPSPPSSPGIYGAEW